MLNYKNDFLLLNKETANDLIKKGKECLIFLDKEKKILNLFSAFVKKSDFIKKDKINQPFQKTVYVKVSKKLTNEINKEFQDKKQLKKLLEQYIDRRSNVNVNRWFKNRTFPFVALRVISKDKKDFIRLIGEINYFTDFVSRSRFYHPKNVEDLLNPKTIYLVGCSLGDGYIRKDGRNWVLVDGSSKEEMSPFSKQYILNLSNLIKNFVNTFKIQEHRTKYELKINNKLFCRFLNFFFGLPLGKKKNSVLRKPLILSFNHKDLEMYFWRGYFDTDGSVNKQGAVDFCSSDENILDECRNYLSQKDIKSKIKRPVLVINMHCLKKFSSVGFAHPRKQKEFLAILKRGPKFKSVKIKEDQQEKIDKKLLDICDLIRVDDNYRIRIHSFLLKEKKIDLKQVKQIIKELFGYELKVASNNLLYFKSKKVHDYLRRFFVYEPAWKPINNKEEICLLNNWNNIWSK